MYVFHVALYHFARVFISKIFLPDNYILCPVVRWDSSWNYSKSDEKSAGNGASIKKIGPSKASLFACSEIPAVTIFSILFLKDSFTWIDILGFLMIASTVFILSEKKH